MNVFYLLKNIDEWFALLRYLHHHFVGLGEVKSAITAYNLSNSRLGLIQEDSESKEYFPTSSTDFYFVELCAILTEVASPK